MPEIGNSAVWKQTDTDNTTGTQPSWSGSASPDTIDNAGRAMMGAITREWNWRNFTLTSTGSSNTFVLTYTVAPAALYDGQIFAFETNHAVTGAATLNVNSLGAKDLKKVVAGALTDLASGDAPSGTRMMVAYDSGADDFVWINRPGVEPSGTIAQGNIIYRSATDWAVLAPGTAGQVLQTAGAGANPAWATPTTGATTFLGTISTASGASASLGTLTLTGYQFVELWFNGVSHSGSNDTWLIGNSTSDDVEFTGGSITTTHTMFGCVRIDLATGIGCTNLSQTNGTGGGMGGFDSAITTASTTISIAPNSGSWDAGSIRIYGVS
jgi:hypothetical protein